MIQILTNRVIKYQHDEYRFLKSYFYILNKIKFICYRFNY